jgi:isopentenyldiphosphate isomerase
MKPKIQIVDESDNIIGHKDRGEVDYQKDIYRVAALWLTNSKDEVLIAQRKLTKDKDPGKWGPAVAGTVDEGETYDSNIYKEAEEEIGLTGAKFDLGPKQRVRQPRNYWCQWYTVSLDKNVGDFHIQEDEVERIAWVPMSWLVSDVKANPKKYIPIMPELVGMFSKLNT